jgi:hypothetical protein
MSGTQEDARAAQQALVRCERCLRYAQIDAKAAGLRLGAARAARCVELSQMLTSAYEHAARLATCLEADISTAKAEDAWTRQHPIAGQK